MPETDRIPTTPAHRLPPPSSSRPPATPPVALPGPVPAKPSRRGVLASVAGLLALGAAARAGAVPTGVENPDAELIALCDRIVATDEERERLESPYYDTFGSPPHISEQTAAVVAEGHRLSEIVAGMDAATPEGVRAKARAMMSYACTTLDGVPDWNSHGELLGWSIARDLLRGEALGAAALVLAPIPAALAAPADAVSDAAFIALCAEHAVNRDAFNDDGTLDPGDGPLWAAYDRTRTVISEARPRTLEGVLAKARIAKAEALNPDGSESIEGSVAAQWSWDVVNDLLRLNGRV